MHEGVNRGISELLNNGMKQGRKQMAVLVDPDKWDAEELAVRMQIAEQGGVEYVLVGGSLLSSDRLGACIRAIKNDYSGPVLLFPGSGAQIHEEADGIMLLSLISGRNADLLIGKHVESAARLKASGLEILPTGYMLIDGGRTTTAIYISGSAPIPADKAEIAAMTALAGEMLGLHYIYVDCGSGAESTVRTEMIAAIRKEIDIPLIVGGGIRTTEDMEALYAAGADILVVGNIGENDKAKLAELVEWRKKMWVR